MRNKLIDLNRNYREKTQYNIPYMELRQKNDLKFIYENDV